MYLPKMSEETRLDVLHGLIGAHPLGAWVMAGEGALDVNPIPFHLDPARGPFGTLVGHVARANPVWKAPPSPLPALVIFSGPQAYVTPSWYPSKHAHGKAVPTWNYAVVTVHGRPRFIEDRAWLRAQVGQLTDAQEAGQALPWKVEDAPEDYTDAMLGAIIGVEIPIDRIEGKWKTNHNRSEADKRGVVAGLLDKGDAESCAMAALVEQRIGG